MDYDVGKAFEEIEEYLIDSMMRNFKHHRAEETKEGYKWSQWQAEQLKALELYRKNNSKKFKKDFLAVNSKIEEMIKIARKDGNAAQEIEILEAIKNGLIIKKKPSATAVGEFFKVNDKKLNALIKATTDDLQKAETTILRMADDQYRKAIFNAQTAMNTGAVTYEQAIDIACRDMLRAGLNCVEYKNRARHTLSDYADMAIKTANKRAYLYGEGQKRQEWGISTVVVNSRQGGCPDCAKFIGKVFIDDVYSGGKRSDGNYPLLSSAIAMGLFHPRCKDSTSTYYEDITTLDPELSKWEIKDLEELEQYEQQANHARNEAKKCQRIAYYSLDKANQLIYQHRAEKWKEKAEKIGENIPETVENSADNGIIKDKKSANYKNVGSSNFEKKDKRILYQTERIISGNNYETAVLYNSNGKIVFSKKGKKDSVSFSKSEISKMEGGILTHNHPNGSVFSADDINMLRKGKLAEIRACNSRGSYVLRHSGEWDKSISDLSKIRKEYDDIQTQIEKKYSDIAFKDGKSIVYYWKQIDEETMSVFSERHGLQFEWEDK